jgi:carboxyl-terminal processing protease
MNDVDEGLPSSSTRNYITFDIPFHSRRIDYIWVILDGEDGSDKLKRWAKVVTNSLFAAAIFLKVAVASPQSSLPTDDITVESLKFTEAYNAIQQNFAEAVDPDKTVLDGGIRGMLSALDPFSAFFDREQFELLKQQTRGEALGFGSILYVTPGKILVLQTAQDSPSWRAGLGPGDEIVEINGTRVNRLSFQSLVEFLRNSRSHPVRLGVIHAGKFVAQDFDLKPAEVALPSVDKSFVLSPGIGYIHLSEFEQKTPQEVSDALVRLATPPLEGLVLDLRDNHGGVVDAAIGVASLFLKPDTLVMTVRGRSSPEKAHRTTPASKQFDLPMIVLVNGDTASAAELLAAALQEHDRAVIAGEPTYGKGVVESVIALSEDTGLALTTAQYFTPSGRSIQRPLPGTALAAPGRELDPATDSSHFHTDDGRPVSPSGGIAPDVELPSRKLDPWVTFLNQIGIFTNFASQYLTPNVRVDKSFEPTATMLEEFKEFLRGGGVRTPEEYWAKDQDYLRLRIKAELLSLVFGLSTGEEVDTKGDPEVQKAASLFSQIPGILRGAGKER